MIKVKVIEKFTLGRFDELENLTRKSFNNNQYGSLFVGDTFTCTEKMADYLINKNPMKRPFVTIIEVIPDKKEETETKPKTPRTRKTTIKKKDE